ncbi:twin-arginine translocase subunit TatC [soil metagenome]
MTLVDHLDELRTRIVWSVVFLLVASSICFVFNDQLLTIANNPLPNGREPLTFGITEPFFQTTKLAIYGGILISLPFLLYQGYAFLLPALAPGERKVIVPFLMMVPVLFIAGAVFAYFVVVPAAAKFLLNFNSDNFNIQIRASEYYGFFITTVMSVGILFQIPIGILAFTRLGIVTPQQLAKNRRYAILGEAVIAMLLPGTDPVTMLISMAPLVVLYEGSIVLARIFGTPKAATEPDDPDDPDKPDETDDTPGGEDSPPNDDLPPGETPPALGSGEPDA